MDGTRFWRIFGTLSALVLYGAAMSGHVYDATTPVSLPLHELLRKTYALLAFALLGFALERSRLRRLQGWIVAAAAIGLYSAAIEAGQILFLHSTESLPQHAFDVASGVVGGVLGEYAANVKKRRSPSVRWTEGIALLLALLALAYAFLFTYAPLDRGASATGSGGASAPAARSTARTASRRSPA